MVPSKKKKKKDKIKHSKTYIFISYEVRIFVGLQTLQESRELFFEKIRNIRCSLCREQNSHNNRNSKSDKDISISTA